MFVEDKTLPEAPVKELEQWQRICLKAADHIDKHGWCQFGRIDRGGGTGTCMYGALSIAVFGQPFPPEGERDPPILELIWGILSGRLGTTPMTWNDTPGRTKKEVTAFLRSVA